MSELDINGHDGCMHKECLCTVLLVLESCWFPPPQASSKLEVVTVLLGLEERVLLECGGVWRKHADVLHHMARLVPWMPPSLLIKHLIPRMVDRMHTARALPCRVSAARTLLIYLQYLPSEDLQQEVVATLVREFCESSSCHERMLFLTVCSLCLELLPDHLFKRHLSKHLLALHTDKVANIRLRVVSLLPVVKASFVMPLDKPLLQVSSKAVVCVFVCRDVPDSNFTGYLVTVEYRIPDIRQLRIDNKVNK